MNISLKQIKLFAAIADTQQVSLAAQKLFISQSAASMSLALLEENLKVKLFDRIGKRLLLTDKGKKLLSKAHTILQEVTDFENIAKEDSIAGTLRIAASKTIGQYFLPAILMQFSKLYPNVDFAYEICNSEDVVGHVLTAEVDVGFIESEYKNKNCELIQIKEDSLGIFVKNEHPLAKKKKVSNEDLIKYPWILREKGSGTRAVINSRCKAIIKNLNIVMELQEPEAIKKAVQNSDAISCLSKEILASELKAKTLTLLNTSQFDLQRDFNLILLQDKARSLLLETFVAYLEMNILNVHLHKY